MEVQGETSEFAAAKWTFDCSIRQFLHGQTYQAHPMVCAAALEVQRIIQQQDLVKKAQRTGGLLEVLLRKNFETHPQVGNIRGRGLFWAVSLDVIHRIVSAPSVAPYCYLLTPAGPKLEFVKEKSSKEPFDPALAVAMAVFNEGITQAPGVMTYPGTGSADGLRGDHIIIAPPYNVTNEEIEMIVAAATKAVNSVFGRILQVA